MISVTLQSGTTTASTPVNLTKVLKTNSDTNIVNGNSIQIVNPGIYEINGSVTLTSIATGEVGIGVYVNGTLYGLLSSAYFAASGNYGTVPLHAVFEIDPSNSSSYATVTLLTSGTPTIGAGEFALKKLV